jgi:hypothetical protein
MDSNIATKSRVSGAVKHFRENAVFYLGVTVIVVLGMTASYAYAAFDLDKAGKAFTDPIQSGIDKYWPIGVLGFGVGGFFAAQGDMRTKALGFGAGSLLAGLAMGAVKMGFGL